MSILHTEVFSTITGADAEKVWEALTATGRPIDFLYGITFRGPWRQGSTIVASIGEQFQLTGEVLAMKTPPPLLHLG